MSATLLKALIAFIPASLLLIGAAVTFSRRKTIGSFLQTLGAGCLLVVVLTHIFEALRLFPWMHWGDKHSAGHYLDLSSAILALALLPAGILLHILRPGPRPASPPRF
jgi:succinate dehydrogenase/fumarate reductase cytochrome b subunit